MAVSWGRIPQDYGAVGNGTADDTAAFQGLFQDAANEEGLAHEAREQEFFIPAGTYRITQALTLAASVSIYCLPGAVLDFQLSGSSTPCISWVINAGNTRVYRPRWWGGRIRRDSTSGPAIRLASAEHGFIGRAVFERANPYVVVDSPGSVATIAVLVQLCEGVAGAGAGAAIGVDVGQTGGSKTSGVKVAHCQFAGAGAGAAGCRFRNGDDNEAFFVRATNAGTHATCATQTRFILTNPNGTGISTFLASDSGSTGCVVGRNIALPGSGTWAKVGV